MAKIPVALQLYSVRDDCEKDFIKTLAAVAEMGYEGVEFAGYYGKSAKELKQKLDDLGLRAAGTHTGLDGLLGDELKKTIDYNKILGNCFLIVPYLPPERINSKDECLKIADVFNKISIKLKQEGMHIGYHNHFAEFAAIDGVMPWDIIFTATSKEVVMQLDTGNAMHAGVKSDGVLEFIKKYPGRAMTVHLKEFSSADDKAILGEGEMKWKEFAVLCEKIGGTKWFILEHEIFRGNPIEGVKKSLENFKNIMKS